jgi:ferrous iron transport protein B
MKKIRVAVVGQPNVGKSTLFNALTGGSVVVTNWPGTTVSRTEGTIKYRDYQIDLVDLPGVYSLSALTLEEKISRDFIVNEKPDVIVVLVDSLSLIRTLYLPLEILELTGKVVIGVTKIDEAHKRGIHINPSLLEKQLNVPVVALSAVKNIGLTELIEKIIEVYENTGEKRLRIDYGELNTYIEAAEDLIEQSGFELSPRWLAVKVFEDDREILELIRSRSENLYKALLELREEAIRVLKVNPAIVIARSRVNYAEKIGDSCIVQVAVKRKATVSKIFYHPILAPIISIGTIIMAFILAFTVNTGFPITQLLEVMGFGELAEMIEEFTISSLIEKIIEESSEVLKSAIGENIIARFLSEAVLGGVGAVLLFLPLIMIVMAIIGALEDSGVLTRIAVGFHILFEKLGLSGHALFPMSISLGCNVPGIIVTRNIPSGVERGRLIMLLPFIPCQARLVVLLALATAVEGGFLLVVTAYLVSFAVFFTLEYVLHLWSAMRGEVVEVRLLLEQPPLHRPIPRVVWWYTWWHTKHFLVKAGSIILLANIVFWVLAHTSLTQGFTDNPSESIAASISRVITPVLEPLGITGDNAWIISLAVITGFIAKELVISVLIGVTGAESVKEALIATGVSEHAIIPLAVFITLYVPCLATVATIYSETRSLKLAIRTVVQILVMAYLVAFLTHAVIALIPT